MNTPREPSHLDPHEPPQESWLGSPRDGLGPVPLYSSAQRAAARTMLLAHVKATSTSTAPHTGQGHRPTPRRGGMGHPLGSRRAMLIGVSVASVAVLAAGAVYVEGGFDTARSGRSVLAGEPVLPMSPVGFTLPSAAVTTDSSECTTSKGSEKEGDGLRYLLDEATARAGGNAVPRLQTSMVRTDNCFTTGWPTASFVATTPDGQHLTQAITVWGPGVQGLAAPSSDDRVRATAVGDHPARVMVVDWGVLESWTTPDGTWSITAAGAEEATVQRLAETVAASGGKPAAADLQAQLAGLRAMPIPMPAPPEVPYSTFSATYGPETFGSDVTDRLELDVSPARVPWAAWASTGPLDGTELVDVDGVTGWSVQDASDPFGMLVWEVAPGVGALLRGQVEGSKDLTPYARAVQEVSVADPRIQVSDVDH